jgi:hypothetical protein
LLQSHSGFGGKARGNASAEHGRNEALIPGSLSVELHLRLLHHQFADSNQFFEEMLAALRQRDGINLLQVDAGTAAKHVRQLSFEGFGREALFSLYRIVQQCLVVIDDCPA